MKTILNFILQERIIYNRAEKIALNAERGTKSKSMAITSIIFSIIAIIGAVGLPFLCYSMFVTALTTNLAIIGNIFLFCFAVSLLPAPIMLARFAIVFSRAQRKINQLKIGTVSKHLARVSIILSLALLVGVIIYLVGLNNLA